MILNIIFFLALIVFVITAYKKPIWAVGSVIVLLPSYLWRFNILGLPTTFLELMVVSLFVVWLARDKKYKKINFKFSKKSTNKLDKNISYLLALWLLASVIGWLINPTYSALGLWRAYFLEPMMYFLVFVYTVKDKKDLQVIINSLALLVSWLFVVAIYQNFTNWNYLPAYNFPNVKRLTAVFSYPNALSLLTAPITTFFLVLWAIIKEKKSNWHYLEVAIFGLLLALLAVSEGALGAIMLSLFIVLILAKKIRKYTIPALVIIFVLSLFVLPTIRYARLVWNQLANPDLSLQASSLEIRSSQWRETWQMLGDNWAYGSGIDGYQAALASYHHISWIEIYLYPHNIFLNFWTEIGLFGLTVFLGLMVYIIFALKEIFKNKNQFAWPLSLMWLTWFVHGLVDVPYFKNDLSILFFVMLAMTIVIKSNVNKKRK